MSYQDKSNAYADPNTRGRIFVCATEQAYIFVNDARPEWVQLAERAIAGEPQVVNALAAGVCSSPDGANLDDDAALLSAMQAVWPSVANAMYIEPEEPPTEGV